jgi:hypothetical protein
VPPTSAYFAFEEIPMAAAVAILVFTAIEAQRYIDRQLIIARRLQDSVRA